MASLAMMQEAPVEPFATEKKTSETPYNGGEMLCRQA
jgi:hypothetical protein